MNIFRVSVFLLILFCISVFKYCVVYPYSGMGTEKFSTIKISEDKIYMLTDNGVDLVKINNYDNMEIENVINEKDIYDGKIVVHKNNLLVSGIRYFEGKPIFNILIYNVYGEPEKINDITISGDRYFLKDRYGIIYFCVQGEEGRISLVSIDLNHDEIFPKIQELDINNEINFISLGDEFLYIFCNNRDGENVYTNLYRFCINEDLLTYVDSVSLNGRIADESFIDEYEGNLKIFSLINESKNGFYVLNEDFEIVTFLNDVFENRKISDIYFDKDMCYVCEFLRNGYFGVYEFRDNYFKEVSKLKLPTNVNYISGMNKESFIIVGNDSRTNKYKNIDNYVYQVVKNNSVRVFSIDTSNQKRLKISDEFIIKENGYYFPSLIEKDDALYSKNDNVLLFPLGIVDLNEYLDLNIAMEVNKRFDNIRLLDCNIKSDGIYVFNENEGKIVLKSIIDDQDEIGGQWGYKNINQIKFYENNIFVFLDFGIKVFDFDGKFLGEINFIDSDK